MLRSIITIAVLAISSSIFADDLRLNTDSTFLNDVITVEGEMIANFGSFPVVQTAKYYFEAKKDNGAYSQIKLVNLSGQSGYSAKFSWKPSSVGTWSVRARMQIVIDTNWARYNPCYNPWGGCGSQAPQLSTITTSWITKTVEVKKATPMVNTELLAAVANNDLPSYSSVMTQLNSYFDNNNSHTEDDAVPAGTYDTNHQPLSYETCENPYYLPNYQYPQAAISPGFDSHGVLGEMFKQFRLNTDENGNELPPGRLKRTVYPLTDPTPPGAPGDLTHYSVCEYVNFNVAGSDPSDLETYRPYLGWIKNERGYLAQGNTYTEAVDLLSQNVTTIDYDKIDRSNTYHVGVKNHHFEGLDQETLARINSLPWISYTPGNNYLSIDPSQIRNEDEGEHKLYHVRPDHNEKGTQVIRIIKKNVANECEWDESPAMYPKKTNYRNFNSTGIGTSIEDSLDSFRYLEDDVNLDLDAWSFVMAKESITSSRKSDELFASFDPEDPVSVNGNSWDNMHGISVRIPSDQNFLFTTTISSTLMGDSASAGIGGDNINAGIMIRKETALFPFSGDDNNPSDSEYVGALVSNNVSVGTQTADVNADHARITVIRRAAEGSSLFTNTLDSQNLREFSDYNGPVTLIIEKINNVITISYIVKFDGNRRADWSASKVLFTGKAGVDFSSHTGDIEVVFFGAREHIDGSPGKNYVTFTDSFGINCREVFEEE